MDAFFFAREGLFLRARASARLRADERPHGHGTHPASTPRATPHTTDGATEERKR